jgi:ribosome-associated toxin RatA of RatAB toxin-antitoxin module
MQPMPITEHTLVSEVVQASPETCFAVATDLASYPAWVPAITSVEVLRADDQGRPVEAAFQAEAMGRRSSYVLVYDYADAPHSFRWQQVRGDLTRRLDGAYTFELSDDETNATTVVYELDIELAVPLPGFVKRRAETKILSAALNQFRVRAESV